MATTIGKLNFLVTADGSGVSTGLNQASAAIKGFSQQSQSHIGQIFTGNLLADGAMMAVQKLNQLKDAVLGGAMAAIKAASDYEQLAISFRVMLGSGEAATAMLKEIEQFAYTTPLDTAGLANSAKTLMQFGMAGDEIMPTLQLLGDVAGADADRMQRLALVFGQIQSAGKLMGQDLLQLINLGFNPLQQMAKTTGVHYDVLRKKMEEGGISAGMVTDSFKVATGEGGRMNGMLEETGKSVKGSWSQLNEEVSLLAKAFGNMLAPSIMEALDVAIDFVQYLRESLMANRELVEGLAKAFADIVKGAWWLFGGEIPENPVAESIDDSVGAAARLKAAVQDAVTPDTEGLKDALKIVRDEISAAKKMHSDLQRDIEGQRGRFTGAASRFTQEGFAAPFKAAQEQQIQTELRAMRTQQAEQMKALLAQEEEIEEAIKETKITVKEGRI